MAVPTTCGIETEATASFAPTATDRSGVSTLPMPNPATDAIAPATTPAAATASFSPIIQSDDVHSAFCGFYPS